MTITSGDIWIADIPFTNGWTSKKRPVLILWIDAQDVIVAAITSASPRTATDVVLQDWQQSRLRIASVVRLARLDCLEKSLQNFLKLSDEEQDAIATKLLADLSKSTLPITPEDDPDDTPTNDVIEGLRQGLHEALTGQTIPIAQMLDGIDAD